MHAHFFQSQTDHIPGDGGIVGWERKRVLEHLEETLPQEGELCDLDGHPCILYGERQLAEDWSGEYVDSDLHPFALSSAPRLTPTQFWELVRRTHPR
jgi:hypothetical protein